MKIFLITDALSCDIRFRCPKNLYQNHIITESALRNLIEWDVYCEATFYNSSDRMINGDDDASCLLDMTLDEIHQLRKEKVKSKTTVVVYMGWIPESQRKEKQCPNKCDM